MSDFYGFESHVVIVHESHNRDEPATWTIKAQFERTNLFIVL